MHFFWSSILESLLSEKDVGILRKEGATDGGGVTQAVYVRAQRTEGHCCRDLLTDNENVRLDVLLRIAEGTPLP